MRHHDIRLAVYRRLRAEHGLPPATVYRNELAICLGETRVDVAAINGRISGFEIKSDRDSLSRLDRQVSLYGRVLDTAVIVTEERFAAKAFDAVPHWWGIWRCVPAGRWPRMEQVRSPGRNPQKDPFSIAQLLWRDEVLAELAARELAAGLRRATRWKLWAALVEHLTVVEIDEVVRHRLMARRSW